MGNKLNVLTDEFLEECSLTESVYKTLKSLEEITEIEKRLLDAIDNTKTKETKDMLKNMLNEWQIHSKKYIEDIILIAEEIRKKGYDNENVKKELLKKYEEEAVNSFWKVKHKKLTELFRSVAVYNIFIKTSKEQGIEIKAEDILEKKENINKQYKDAFNEEVDFYELSVNEELDLDKYVLKNADVNEKYLAELGKNALSITMKKYLPNEKGSYYLDIETNHLLEDCSYATDIDSSLKGLNEILNVENKIKEFVNVNNENPDLNIKLNSMLYMWQKHSKIYLDDLYRIQSDLGKKGHTLYGIDKKPKEYLLNLIQTVAKLNYYLKRVDTEGLNADNEKVNEFKKSINILYRKTFDEETEFYRLDIDKELLGLDDHMPSKSKNFSTDFVKPLGYRGDTLVSGKPIIKHSNDARAKLIKNASITSSNKEENIKKRDKVQNSTEKMVNYVIGNNPMDYPFSNFKIVNTNDCCYSSPYFGLDGVKPQAPIYPRNIKRKVWAYYVRVEDKIECAYDSYQLAKLFEKCVTVIGVGTIDGYYKMEDIIVNKNLNMSIEQGGKAR